MKLVTVEDLREGDIIASDVLLEDYTVVLSKGTVIKAPYIDKLREMDIFTVYIEESQGSTKVSSAPKPQKPVPKASSTPAPQKPMAQSPTAPVQPNAPAPQRPVAQAPKAPVPQRPVAQAPKAPAVQEEKPAKSTPKKNISMEKVTILRDDVEEQVKSKIKDILELHVYKQTEGLEKIADTAQNILYDIV